MSGISNEIFRQIETVENRWVSVFDDDDDDRNDDGDDDDFDDDDNNDVDYRYDQSTAEAFRTVQKSGEMVLIIFFIIYCIISLYDINTL